MTHLPIFVVVTEFAYPEKNPIWYLGFFKSNKPSNKVFLSANLQRNSHQHPPHHPFQRSHWASPSIIDDDESLLHQLRREEFQKQNRGKDYFFDPSGRYNISVDDVSTFLSSANGANSTVFSPSVSRVAEPPSQDLSISAVKPPSLAIFRGFRPREGNSSVVVSRSHRV